MSHCKQGEVAVQYVEQSTRVVNLGIVLGQTTEEMGQFAAQMKNVLKAKFQVWMEAVVWHNAE